MKNSSAHFSSATATHHTCVLNIMGCPAQQLESMSFSAAAHRLGSSRVPPGFPGEPGEAGVQEDDRHGGDQSQKDQQRSLAKVSR